MAVTRLLTRRTLLQALLAQAIPSATANAQAVVYREPTPLAPDAVTHDWASFLGPSHNVVSTETPLRRDLGRILPFKFLGGIDGRLRLAISVIRVHHVKLCLPRDVAERVTRLERLEVGERHLEIAVGHGRGTVLIQPFWACVLDDVIVTTTAGEDRDKRNANDQWFFRNIHVLIPSYGAHKDAELRQTGPHDGRGACCRWSEFRA